MRQIVVTKYQFEDFVFPALTSSAAENESELSTAVGVFRKLRDATTERAFNKEEQEARAAGARIRPQLDLILSEVTFLLEESEYQLILDRLTRHIKNVSLIAAIEYEDLLTLFRSAERIDAVKPVTT